MIQLTQYLNVRILIFFFYLTLITHPVTAQNKDLDEPYNYYKNQFYNTEFQDKDSSKVYVDSAFAVAVRSGSDYMIGDALILKAEFFYMIKENDSAFYYSNLSTVFLDTYKDSAIYNIAHYNLGNVYMDMEMDLSALIEYNRVLINLESNFGKYADADKNEVGISLLYTYASICDLHIKLGDTSDVSYYLLKAQKLIELIDDESTNNLRPAILGFSAELNLLKGNYDKALSELNQCLELNTSLGIMPNTCSNLHLMSKIEWKRANFKKALADINSSIECAEAEGLETDLLESNLFKLQVLLSLNELDSAMTLANQLMPQIELRINQRLAPEFYRLQAKILFAIGKVDLAYLAMEKVVMKERESNSWRLTSSVDQLMKILVDQENRITDEVDKLKLQQQKETLSLRLERDRTKRCWEYMFFSIAFLSILIIVILIVRINLKNQKINLILTQSLEEKKVLFQEVHHRVKNNFQLIMSLLRLQKNSSNNPNDDLYKDAESRIQSMALIHELLYRQNEAKAVDFRSYVDELLSGIKRSTLNQKIVFKSEVAQASFDISLAIQLGLILNELITNSVKHAFADGRDGEIFVGLENTGDQNYVLIVRDNGIGMTEEMMSAERNSLGLDLIQLLSEQVGASLSHSFLKGTEIRISFDSSNPALMPV